MLEWNRISQNNSSMASVGDSVVTAIDWFVIICNDQTKVYSAYIELSSTSLLLFSSFFSSSHLSLFNLLHLLPFHSSNKHALWTSSPIGIIIVFLKEQKFLKLPTQSSIQNAFLFLSGDIYSDSLSLERSGVEWITPKLSIEAIIQFNKGQMSLKVKTFISKSHCSKFPDLS